MVDKYKNPIIIDFGFALKKTDPLFKKFNVVGTPEFYPYEMLKRRENGFIMYDEKVDIWCLGIILYEMLYGITPFYVKSDNRDKIKENILAFKYIFPTGYNYQSVNDLIAKILRPPEERISLDAILLHPWINNKAKMIKRENLE